jgi:hypothetical protein
MSDTDPYAAKEYTPAVEYANYDSFDQAPAETPAEKPVEAPVVEEATVPEGSIKDVLGWVGDDSTKAQQALNAEEAGEGRKTLISQLKNLINN